MCVNELRIMQKDYIVGSHYTITRLRSIFWNSSTKCEVYAPLFDYNIIYIQI